ncbi:hypothetical protein FJZ26_03160 [Candidatus Parvarchaeota archaeon]|nr:hypothetical protein [Candidatus Parvarchaeota archaeon]
MGTYKPQAKKLALAATLAVLIATAAYLQIAAFFSRQGAVYSWVFIAAYLVFLGLAKHIASNTEYVIRKGEIQIVEWPVPGKKTLSTTGKQIVLKKDLFDIICKTATIEIRSQNRGFLGANIMALWGIEEGEARKAMGLLDRA